MATKRKAEKPPKLTSVEVCAGAGGQALGLESAGFQHAAVIEVDHWACETLKTNRGSLWNVIQADMRDCDMSQFRGVDLYAGGLPCPPFSVAGKQLGASDERNLFGVAIDHIAVCKPRAVMIENVRGILSPRFDCYRQKIEAALSKLGFISLWHQVEASNFGVPQLRPRVVLVALQSKLADRFVPPQGKRTRKTVGGQLKPLMSANGWQGAKKWSDGARSIAPTIVGGSKKHGGADLGPSRSKLAWKKLGVDALCVADAPPEANAEIDHTPRLTVPMVSKLQGFPTGWKLRGGKTASYRQVGNAFPPPVAAAIAQRIFACIRQGQ